MIHISKVVTVKRGATAGEAGGERKSESERERVCVRERGGRACDWKLLWVAPEEREAGRGGGQEAS